MPHVVVCLRSTHAYGGRCSWLRSSWFQELHHWLQNTWLNSWLLRAWLIHGTHNRLHSRLHTHLLLHGSLLVYGRAHPHAASLHARRLSERGCTAWLHHWHHARLHAHASWLHDWRLPHRCQCPSWRPSRSCVGRLHTRLHTHLLLHAWILSKRICEA